MSPTVSRPDSASTSVAPIDAARAERDARLAALLTASARGNTSAFEEFFAATAGYARALARRVLRSDDTDDLLADAFFEAWRAAARFDPARGSAVTWLLVIVRSRALDLLRQRATHPSVAGTDTSLHELADESATDPSERLWQQQAGTRLHAALQLLTAAERWVLGLAYFRELTHAEIAARTCMPLGTVKSHITRAQTKLRDHLSPSCR
jgi:RNA polymerase sigma-70 factor, ECF subfamily